MYVQYYAPYTGAGEYQLKAGTRFFLSDSMRDDAFYMRIQGEFDKNLYNELVEVEKAVEILKLIDNYYKKLI